MTWWRPASPRVTLQSLSRQVVAVAAGLRDLGQAVAELVEIQTTQGETLARIDSEGMKLMAAIDDLVAEVKAVSNAVAQVGADLDKAVAALEAQIGTGMTPAIQAQIDALKAVGSTLEGIDQRAKAAATWTAPPPPAP